MGGIRNYRDLSLRKVPAGHGFGEVCGVLVLTESDSRANAKDTAAARFEQRANIAAILAVVNVHDLLPDGSILDFFGDTLEDYGFVGFFRSDDAVRFGGHVFCFARAGASAKPEGILPPDAPNKHEVRLAFGTRRGDPIVVRFFEALKGPLPGFEAGRVVGRILQGVRPVGTACLGFGHCTSFQWTEVPQDFSRPRGMKLRRNRLARRDRQSEILVVPETFVA